MMTHTNDRDVITSLDEIPQFASEDDEREWWATHEFSDDLWKELSPGWDDLPWLLDAPLAAYRAPQVEYPLDVARRHLSYVRPGREIRGPLRFDVRYEHAVSVVVFAASAVEAGLNLWLTVPHLARTQDDGIVGDVPREVAWPVHKKLHHVAKRAEELRDHDALLQRIEALLSRRDNLVHGLPTTGGPMEDDVAQAREYYDAAEAFLGQLILPAIKREQGEP